MKRNKLYNQAYKLIKRYNTILILGHVRPDGDCLGSQFGLERLIKANFKSKNTIVVGEPAEGFSLFPPRSSALEVMVEAPALAIVVDTRGLDRVDGKELLELADKVIQFDHHDGTETECFGDIQILDPEAASCTEQISDFALEQKLTIDTIAAEYLYFGLLTDTGRFQYPSVSQNTFNTAAKLSAVNPQVVSLANALEKTTATQVSFRGFVINKIKFDKAGFAYVVLNKEDLEKYSMNANTAYKELGNMRHIEGYPIYFMACETEEGTYRVSLRSEGPEINGIAEEFGGGGHKLAAGCILKTKEELKTLLKNIKNLLKNI